MPCIIATSKFWLCDSYSLGDACVVVDRIMHDCECLNIQGLEFSKQQGTGAQIGQPMAWVEKDLMDLAGNSFTGTVVAAAILALFTEAPVGEAWAVVKQLHGKLPRGDFPGEASDADFVEEGCMEAQDEGEGEEEDKVSMSPRAHASCYFSAGRLEGKHFAFVESSCMVYVFVVEECVIFQEPFWSTMCCWHVPLRLIDCLGSLSLSWKNIEMWKTLTQLGHMLSKCLRHAEKVLRT